MTTVLSGGDEDSLHGLNAERDERRKNFGITPYFSGGEEMGCDEFFRALESGNPPPRGYASFLMGS